MRRQVEPIERSGVARRETRGRRGKEQARHPTREALTASRNRRSGYFGAVVLKPDTLPRQAGPSDAALVVAARAGEEWAREALFRRYSRKVFGLAYRLLGHDEELEDLVQDCFLQALTHLGRLSEPEAFGAWLTTLVVRTTHKALRRRTLATRLGLRSRRDPVDVDSLVGRSAPADVVAELHAVYRILDELPARVRVALVLRRVEGMSQDEVAAAMRVSVSTAKRLMVEGELYLENALGATPQRRRP